MCNTSTIIYFYLLVHFDINILRSKGLTFDLPHRQVLGFSLVPEGQLIVLVQPTGSVEQRTAMLRMPGQLQDLTHID